MPIIQVQVLIRAPVELCFDLARDVEAHQRSVSHTGERAVAGVSAGLMGLGDTVTWEAVHFGVRQRLTARITEFERPYRFVDEMVAGAFAGFHHTHRFEPVAEGTRMTDVFDYRSPLGPLGRLADVLFLERYMRRFLTVRSEALKRMAEEQAGGR